MPRKNFSSKKSAAYQRSAPQQSRYTDTCWSTGKKRYPSQQEAADVAVVSELQRGVELNVYKCPLCGSWHLTSSSSNPRK